MFVFSWSDSRTVMLSGFIPAACPVVTLENDSVLRRAAGKSYFLWLTCLFPLLRFFLSPDTRERQRRQQRWSALWWELTGGERRRGEMIERVMWFWTVSDKRRQQCSRTSLSIPTQKIKLLTKIIVVSPALNDIYWVNSWILSHFFCFCCEMADHPVLLQWNDRWEKEILNISLLRRQIMEQQQQMQAHMERERRSSNSGTLNRLNLPLKETKYSSYSVVYQYCCHSNTCFWTLNKQTNK